MKLFLYLAAKIIFPFFTLYIRNLEKYKKEFLELKKQLKKVFLKKNFVLKIILKDKFKRRKAYKNHLKRIVRNFFYKQKINGLFIFFIFKKSFIMKEKKYNLSEKGFVGKEYDLCLYRQLQKAFIIIKILYNKFTL